MFEERDLKYRSCRVRKVTDMEIQTINSDGLNSYLGKINVNSP